MGVNSKKANFFTTDALFAAMLLLVGLSVISAIPPSQKEIINEDTLTKDVLNTLSSVNVSDLNDTTVKLWINNGTIERPKNSVLVQVGEFWAKNQNSRANYLLEVFFNQTFSGNENYGISLSIASEILFNRSNSANSNSANVLSSRRMITGVEKGEAITGSTASAYLRRVRDKRTSSFVYFGGFVGQGNITSFIYDIPEDVGPEDITQIIVEVDTPEEFTLYINDNYCDLLSPNSGDLEPDVWDVSHCNSSIISGQNKFFVSFPDLNDAYFGGGYIKVSYLTDEFQTVEPYGNKDYMFPGVNGLVNLFDSFYIPGSLESMTVYLHYFADHSTSNNTFYLTIGNDTVYTDLNSTSIQTITLSDALLSTILNYSEFNKTTVPIRLGFENLTYSVEYTGVADVMLVTDVSGSMEREMGSSNTGDLVNDCSNPAINSSQTSRLSVAKCLDKQFVRDILNISGNEMGLVSYHTYTQDVESLNTDQILLNSVIDSYNDLSYTCICCGINSAKYELDNYISSTEIVSSGTEWLFNNDSLKSEPPRDSNNNSWYSLDYDLDVAWHSGSAILGHEVSGSGIPITTDMGVGIGGNLISVKFSEVPADQSTSIVEFTNGYVSTANTFGISGSDDGWDWPADWGFDNSNADYNGVVDGALNFDWRTGYYNLNYCSGYDCSGGYGITVDINESFFNIINSSGSATLKFDYEWDGNDNPFNTNDEIMIKANWLSPFSGLHELGTELSSEGGDDTLEIDFRNNPDIEFSGTHEQELTDWIEGAGVYYLELGARLRASRRSEWGEVSFDNIEINGTNESDHYFLRKTFTLSASDLNHARRGIINLMAQNSVKLYFNGKLLYSGTPNSQGNYWDERGIEVDGTLFREGDNVIAVELIRNSYDARFDLELIGFNSSRTAAIMVMTDGQANVECNDAGEQINSPDWNGNGVADEPEDDAIQAACDASEQLGIKLYAVGFSTEADEATLEGIAVCGNGKYIKSDNSSALGIFYQDTAIEIAEVSRQSQTIVVGSGNPSQSVIYSDSYISFNFTPDFDNSTPDEISITFQTPYFINCTGNVTIYDEMRVVDAVVTSYSGPHWTNYVAIDDEVVFNLSSYDNDYIFLGDPYIVQIPPSSLSPGNHNITVLIDDGPVNENSTCSQNNSLIYTVMITSATPRSEVVETADGCIWDIEFEDGSSITESIPSSYSGSNACSYTSSLISYNPKDAYDIATYEILEQLDFDNDGRVFININTEDLEIIVTLVSEVPYLWGPAVIQAEVRS